MQIYFENGRLRKFARKSSNIDFFSETFTSLRLWVTHVKNVKKLGVHRIRFSELILSFSGHISTLLTAARMPKFDAAYTEKLEIFYLPTLIFC